MRFFFEVLICIIICAAGLLSSAAMCMLKFVDFFIKAGYTVFILAAMVLICIGVVSLLEQPYKK